MRTRDLSKISGRELFENTKKRWLLKKDFAFCKNYFQVFWAGLTIFVLLVFFSLREKRTSKTKIVRGSPKNLKKLFAKCKTFLRTNDFFGSQELSSANFERSLTFLVKVLVLTNMPIITVTHSLREPRLLSVLSDFQTKKT